VAAKGGEPVLGLGTASLAALASPRKKHTPESIGKVQRQWTGIRAFRKSRRQGKRAVGAKVACRGAGMAWGLGSAQILPIGSKHCLDLPSGSGIEGRVAARSDRTFFPGSELISVAGKRPDATLGLKSTHSSTLTVDQRRSRVPQQRLWEKSRRLCFA
jgi:hypothetical protein